MPVPTHLITGFLGVGKTTAILDLLARKPASEKWAVLVNEFGQVGIDGATLSQSGVAVREVPGGCICCTAQLPLKVALTKLLREVKPDRLIIEPTGVGHPAGIIDALRDPMLAPHVDLVNVITLVDPRQLADARVAALETYRDQLSLADVLVANKADCVDATLLARFHDEAARLWPPKARVAVTEHGRLDPAWLTLTAERPEIRPGHGDAAAFTSRGWRFDAATVFDAAHLSAWFEDLAVAEGFLRGKAVARVGREWQRFDWVAGRLDVAATAWRRDSRIELVARGPVSEAVWSRLEAALRATMKPPSSGQQTNGPGPW